MTEKLFDQKNLQIGTGDDHTITNYSNHANWKACTILYATTGVNNTNIRSRSGNFDKQLQGAHTVTFGGGISTLQ